MNDRPVYKTVEEMFRQLEWCGYECEAGKLEMNVAYIQLKEILRWHNAVKDPPDKDGDYHCYWDGEVFIGAYTIVHGFENNCEKWQEIYIPEPPKESEG
jgi:hypothetical protein